jgi:hypothetical protein
MKDDVTRAFPARPYYAEDGNTHYFYQGSYGMTLRDYFAAKAMQGKLAAGSSVGSYKDEAEDCYLIADSMMEARQ